MKEQYGLIIIKDTEDYIIKTYRLGLLHKEFFGYNATIADNDGLTFEVLKFSTKESYEVYAQLMEALTNDI